MEIMPNGAGLSTFTSQFRNLNQRGLELIQDVSALQALSIQGVLHSADEEQMSIRKGVELSFKAWPV
jgi:hypothetical protein